MILLIIILLISTGDGHGSKATAVIQQGFDVGQYGADIALNNCNKIKSQLEISYGKQVISSKCVSSFESKNEYN